MNIRQPEIPVFGYITNIKLTENTDFGGITNIPDNHNLRVAVPAGENGSHVVKRSGGGTKLISLL